MIRQDKLASYESIEDELRKFEAMERERLGLEEASPEPWHDPNPQTFTSEQRSSTTILMGGLTFVHDQLTKACLEGLGYQVEALPVPDTESLHAGKEFGNRGQCNPTYFTVGNLIKYLIHLRDVEGVPVNRIIEDYVLSRLVLVAPVGSAPMSPNTEKRCETRVLTDFEYYYFNRQGASNRRPESHRGCSSTPSSIFNFSVP